MWYDYLIIPKFIVPPHPALVETSEKFYKRTLKFMANRTWWKRFHLQYFFKPRLVSFLTSSLLEGGHKNANTGLSMGVKIGGDDVKSGKDIIDNAREVIAENCLSNFLNRTY